MYTEKLIMVDSVATRMQEYYGKLDKGEDVSDFSTVNNQEELDLLNATASAPATVTSFENNPDVIKNYELVTDYLGNNQTVMSGLLDSASLIDGSKAEFMRDEFRISTLVNRAVTLGDAPKEVVNAYNDLKAAWDSSELTGFGEWAGAVKDYGIDLVANYETIPMVASAMFSGGTSVAANAGIRKGLHSALSKGVAAASNNPAKFGAAYGGVFTGAADLASQELNISLENQEEVNYAQTAASTVLGAGLGAGINYGLSRVGSKIRSRRLERDTEIDNGPIVSESKGLALFDEGLDGEYIPASGEAILDNVSGLLSGRTAKVVNDVDETGFEDIIDDFVSDIGGGQSTREEVEDIVLGALKSGETGDKIKNKVAFGLWKAATELVGTAFGGKASGVLTSFVPYSKTAETLRKRLSHDFGITTTGKQKERVTMDFSEVAATLTGGFRERFKAAVEPIALNSVKGNLEDDVNAALNRAIRGQMSPDKDINVAAVKIQNLFKDIGEQLFEGGLIDKKVENYIPRMWNRKAIENNQNDFAKLLIDEGEAADIVEAERIIKEMLDIENQLSGGTAGHFFSAKRKFTDISNEAKLVDYLEDDLLSVIETYNFQAGKSLAKIKVLNSRGEADFIKKWIEPIAKEMKAAGQALTKKDKERIRELYRLTTGENLKRFSDTVQTGADGYQLATRTALLPLATVGSLTEVLINVGKAGVINSAKGFAQASEVAYRTITNDLHTELRTKHGLTANEVWRELQSFGKAIDQSVGQIGNRLGGDDLIHEGMQKASNKFFRLNLLDQWTKFVQITSYATGKNLIEENLKALAAHGNKAQTSRTESMIGKLNELDVDYKAGVAWINNGSKRTDSFYTDFKRGASRYTNGVILQPTGMSNLKPMLYSDPKTTILFQLLGYPAAFSNTVLKGAAKAVIKDPKTNAANILGAGLSMTAAARFINWVRSRGESESMYVPESEKNLKAIARWGGNGLFLDTFTRAKSAAKYGDNIMGYATMPFGPITGEALNLFQGKPAQVLGNKVPFMGAGNVFLGPDVMRKYRKSLKNIDRSLNDKFVPDFQPNIARDLLSKGGTVEIDRASAEPDERVNKLTGVPYNVEAGTAFMDELDEGRTERFGFNVGGKIAQKLSTPLAEVINKHTDGLFSASKVNNVASEIEEAVTLNANLKALPEDEYYADTMDDIALNQMLVDDVDVEEYLTVAARSVFDDNDANDELMGLAEEVDPDYSLYDTINHMLNPLKDKRDNLVRSEYKDVEDSEALKNLTSFLGTHITTLPFYTSVTQEGAKKSAKQHVAKLLEEGDDGLFSFIKDTAATTPAQRNDNLSLKPSANTQKAIEEFVAESEVNVPVYRGVSSFVNTDYDIAYTFPREMGVHYGNEGQANYQILKELNPNRAVDEFSLAATGGRSANKRKMFEAFQEEMADSGTSLNASSEEGMSPLTVLKGYLNIKNPLFINEDMGSWSADNLLTVEYFPMKDALEESLKRSLTKKELGKIDALSDRALLISDEYIVAENTDKKVGVAVNQIQNELKRVLEHAKLTKDLQGFIKDLGFDGIKYKNAVEPPFRGEQLYSYIAFEPTQFKTVNASKFDVNDPRDMYAKGGSIVARALGIPDEALSWAKSQRDRFPKSESYDGIGDAAAHLALGFITKKSENPKAALFAANAREFVTLDRVGGKMDIHNNKLGASIDAQNYEEAEKVIDTLISDRKAVFMTPSESRARRGYNHGGSSSFYAVSKGDTLSKIAEDNETTVEALMAANDIEDETLIYVNQKLALPVEKEFKENRALEAIKSMRVREGRQDNKVSSALKRLNSFRNSQGLSSKSVESLKRIKESITPEDRKPVNIGGKIAQKLAPKMTEGFYSALEKASLNLNRKEGTGQGFLNDLKKGEKVTEDELYFTGVIDKLKDVKKISKEEVQDVVANSRVGVETKKGSPDYVDPDDGAYDFDTAYDEITTGNVWQVAELEQSRPADYKKYISGEMSFDEAEKFELDAKRFVNSSLSKDESDASGAFDFSTEYEDYTLAGKAGGQPQNYREILIQAPKTDKLKDVTHSNEHFESAPNYKSTLAHIRLSDGVSGEKLDQPTLIIEEIQSDYHQQGSKYGYRKDGVTYTEEDIIKTVKGYKEPFYNKFRQELSKTSDDVEYVQEEASDYTIQALEVMEQFLAAGVTKQEVELFSEKFLNYRIKDIKLADDLASYVSRFDVNYMENHKKAQGVNLKRAELEKEFVKELSEADVNVGRAYQKYLNEDMDIETVPEAPFKKTWHKLAINKALIEAAEEGNTRIALTTGQQQQDRYGTAGGKLGEKYDTAYLSYLKKFGKKYGVKPQLEAVEMGDVTLDLNVLEITSEMKEDILKGLPQFAEGGLVDE